MILYDKPLRFTPSRMVRLPTVIVIPMRVLNGWICYAVIVENGVRLRLNIVDTPGYGDQINNENWCVSALPFPSPSSPTHEPAL